MTTQDIKAIKVLSIIATVAVLKEAQHRKLILKPTLLNNIKGYYLFGVHHYAVNKKN